MFIFQITATLNLLIWVPVISGIVGIIVGIGTIWRVRHENKSKMATKDYVIEQTCIIDKNVSNLKEEVDKNKQALDLTIKEHKEDNIREHGAIIREFTNVTKSMDDKLNTVIQLLK